MQGWQVDGRRSFWPVGHPPAIVLCWRLPHNCPKCPRIMLCWLLCPRDAGLSIVARNEYLNTRKDEWMVVEPTQVSADGTECNKIGTSYACVLGVRGQRLVLLPMCGGSRGACSVESRRHNCTLSRCLLLTCVRPCLGTAPTCVQRVPQRPGPQRVPFPTIHVPVQPAD